MDFDDHAKNWRYVGEGGKHALFVGITTKQHTSRRRRRLLLRIRKKDLAYSETFAADASAAAVSLATEHQECTTATAKNAQHTNNRSHSVEDAIAPDHCRNNDELEYMKNLKKMPKPFRPSSGRCRPSRISLSTQRISFSGFRPELSRRSSPSPNFHLRTGSSSTGTGPLTQV